MSLNNIDTFVNLIRQQFGEEEQHTINANTDIKLLNGWSSLQTMIVVNEIDKTYGIILEAEDFKQAASLSQLFAIIQSKRM